MESCFIGTHTTSSIFCLPISMKHGYTDFVGRGLITTPHVHDVQHCTLADRTF